MNETYARILERVLLKRDSKIARIVFQWLAVAQRPLHLNELAECTALGFAILKPGTVLSYQLADHRPTSEFRVLENCENLVAHRAEDDVVHFAHSTVLEFLLSSTLKSSPLGESISEFFFSRAEAELYVGKACLIYLAFPDFETTISVVPTGRGASAMDMPVTDWVPSMARLDQGGEALWNIASRFIKPSKQPAVTASSGLPQIAPEPRTLPLNTLAREFVLLQYVSTQWIYHCADVGQDDDRCWRIFHNLIFQRTLPFPHLPGELSDAQRDGADDQHFPALLCWAVRNGNRALFTLVVSQANAKCIPIKQHMYPKGMPPLLEVASRHGDDVMVSMIVGLGVDINKRSYTEWIQTALQVAAEGGHLAVVERLLASKADVNAIAAGNHGRTALQAAAGGGHLAVVERLLALKADVNAAPANQYGLTALQAAAKGGHLAVVERLLTSNADVNAAPSGGYGGCTALQAAAGGGHFAVVERLLAFKAHVNVAPAETHGLTALQAAASGGHLVVVELLLASSADVNAIAGGFPERTALQAAASGGYLAIVERLLASEADVNAAPGENLGLTALQAAAGAGHLDVVDCLLASNAIDNTALQAAARAGHLAVVDLLLAAWAHPLVTRSYLESALKAASVGRHTLIVERLMEAIAETNQRTTHDVGLSSTSG